MLTKKQEAFAVAYVKSGNATAAYRKAYASSGMSEAAVNVEASRTLAHPKIALRIEALRAPALKASVLSIERTLQEVARLAYFDPRTLYKEDGNLKRPDEWDDDTAAAVAQLEVLEEYQGKGADRELIGHTRKLKLWDKNAALEKAMKHLGLYERDNAQRSESLALQVVLVGQNGSVSTADSRTRVIGRTS